MKIVFFLLLFLFSCGRLTEIPAFDSPQPAEEEELKGIPAELIGKYENLNDSGYLTITEKGVIIKIIHDLNTSIAELDSVERVNLKDTVYREGNGSMTVKVTYDSVFQHTIGFDTLYYFSRKYVIKKSNGYYFCNRKFHDKWMVRTLRIANNGILISRLKSNENIKFLVDDRFKDEMKFVRSEYVLHQRKRWQF
jgi:hypothetical protein